MMNQSAVPLNVALLFFLSLGSQVIAVSVLPKTDGFTAPLWTITCLIPYLVAMWLIAVMIRQGTALSVVMPLFAAAVPLAAIAVDYCVYGKGFSVTKLGLLVGSCCAIGVAGSMR
jgi:quaternary ammonium compound-resistance protein SugE